MTTSFIPPKRVLMGPGPSDVPQRILDAMARPTIGHLDPAFIAMMEEIKALLQYAFRFLRQVLFGEESIALNAEAAQERLAKVQEKRLIEEREAAKKRAMEAEQETGGDEGFD